MTHDMLAQLTGDVLEEESELTLAELSRRCRVPAERLFELIDEGVVEPFGREPGEWRFRGVSVRRVQLALRLEQDLGVNSAGAALALELLEELEVTRARLKRFEY